MPFRLRDRLPEIHAARERLRACAPDQAVVDRLEREWAEAADPDDREWLVLCRADGTPTGAYAPRWLAHLLGMAHSTAHVGLAMPQGLVVLQRRSPLKAQFPNAWDMAVTGHVSLPAEAVPHPVSYREAAIRELEEELGLPEAELDGLLEGGRLEPIGVPQACHGEGETGGHPWYDFEVRQLFGAVLTPAGLARLTYPDAEISGLLLCRPEEAARLLSGSEGAAGAHASLLELAGWLRKRSCPPG